VNELELLKLALREVIDRITLDIDGWVIFLKGSNINCLKVSRRLLGISFDSEWHFVAPIIIRQVSGESDVRLYREMKRREVQIKRRGVLRFTYEWVTSDLLSRLFPEIKPEYDLAQLLNGDETLHNLLKRSSVDELYINTYFELMDLTNPELALKAHMDNPLNVGWLATTVKGPGSEWRFGPIIRRIYQLLDYLAIKLVDFTKELESRI